MESTDEMFWIKRFILCVTTYTLIKYFLELEFLLVFFSPSSVQKPPELAFDRYAGGSFELPDGLLDELLPHAAHVVDDCCCCCCCCCCFAFDCLVCLAEAAWDLAAGVGSFFTCSAWMETNETGSLPVDGVVALLAVEGGEPMLVVDVLATGACDAAGFPLNRLLHELWLWFCSAMSSACFCCSMSRCCMDSSACCSRIDLSWHACCCCCCCWSCCCLAQFACAGNWRLLSCSCWYFCFCFSCSACFLRSSACCSWRRFSASSCCCLDSINLN